MSDNISCYIGYFGKDTITKAKSRKKAAIFFNPKNNKYFFRLFVSLKDKCESKSWKFLAYFRKIIISMNDSYLMLS